jgi:phage shock protein A
MGIVERAQKVMTSNFNALLSKFEEPGRDIAYLLSEMKEQILAAQRDLIKLMGESKQHQSRADEYAHEIERWEKRAELAVRQGDDALAREALSQKRRLLDEQRRSLSVSVEQRQVAVTMKAEIERMKQKLVEYGQRQHITVAQVTMQRAGGSVEGLGQTGAARPFADLRRLEDAIETTEAETTANAEVDELLSKTSLGSMTRDEVDARFLELERQPTSEIESTLAKNANDEGARTPSVVENASAGSEETVPKVRVRIEP